MTRATTVSRGDWQRRVVAVHKVMERRAPIGQRLRLAAERLVGRAYRGDGLIGDPTTREKLVLDLSSFDCVTLVENVLALARSRSSRGFSEELRRIRYRDGVVDWQARLHYFSDWFKVNERQGFVRQRTRGAGSKKLDLRLSLIKALPSRQIVQHVVPKSDFRQACRRIGESSIIAFATTKAGLDFFHTGLLFANDAKARSAEDFILIHGARSAGQVVAEPLAAFFARNRMRGFAFAEPLEPMESGDRR